MLVELDAFSGRPNPRWQLGEQDHRALIAAHAPLQRAAGPMHDPPALGYRGFVYDLPDGPYRAYRGQVQSPAGVLADPGFDIERFLLDTLPAEWAGLRAGVLAALE